MRVLFISYLFDPDPAVGAQRVSYWALNAAQHGIEAEVITRTDQEGIQRGIDVHVVKEIPSKGILRKFIKDPGIDWAAGIEKYVEESFPQDKKFDLVLMSGGPFLYFKLGSYLKKRFGAKLVLDFRDPFANNPRFLESGIKKFLKKRLEKGFTKSADLVLSVNPYCLELIEKGSANSAFIENGYNETVFENLSAVNDTEREFELVHAGSLYVDRDPTNLVSTINENFQGKVKFVQYGRKPEMLEKFEGSDCYEYRGMKSYSDLIQELQKASATVLITKGDPFESTTKIFDYIALNKRILIVTNGEMRTGNLNVLTENYPNIFWAENNSDSIKHALEAVLTSDVKEFDSESYSRKTSLKKLVDEFKKLTE